MGSGKSAAKAASADGEYTRTDDDNFADALAALNGRRRDTLLEAVTITARDLLNSSNLNATLPNVAEQIGAATGVDRVHIFLINTNSHAGHIEQHYLWTVPGLPTPTEFETPTHPMAEVGLESWIAKLRRGEPIFGHVREFDEPVRALFAGAGVKSVLSVPVFSEGRWLGLIGFDDCRNERNWSAAEIDTLKIVAELVGGSIARASHLKSLSDATRIVENSPSRIPE